MESSEIIALSAVVIALVTTIVSIWQGYLNRQYYRLSTKPHLIIDQCAVIDTPHKFILKNNGLGPAIIKDFSISIDGHDIERSPNSVKESLIALNLDKAGYFSHIPTIGEAISVGDTIIIIDIDLDDKTYDLMKDDLKQLGTRLEFKITYSSIYGQTFNYKGNC
ncbi:hypothetical protein [Aliivibrio fischeri]|uniref:hypothetical protein n=1 Tax=Aliivibrio fischeri TaxID=668 RepID=UPI0007C5BCBC|nr:hypothetical protein [Aliivibrio fischeri]